MQSQPSTERPLGPKRRTRRGCLTCRRRKVKCDERDGSCSNCDRLRLECEWENQINRRQRSRRSKACDRCRDKKLRCLTHDTLPGCRNCAEAGVSCELPGSPESASAERQLAPRPPVSSGPDDCQLPNKHGLLSLFEAFLLGPRQFCFNTFIRPKAYTEMLENQLIPRSLNLTVSATALRCQDPKSTLPDLWADEARELIVKDVFTTMSTTNLQVLILLQRYEWHRGAHLSAWFLAGLAVRLATALQLFRDPSEARANSTLALPVPVMETRRRLMWSCFAMDSIPDAGERPMNPSVDADTIQTRLPCNEASYEAGVDAAQGRIDEPLASVNAVPSISAYLIRMVLLRLRVLQYSYPFWPQSQAKEHSVAPWLPYSEWYGLEKQLHEFRDHLDRDFALEQVSFENGGSGLISTFTVHAMLNAVYIDLHKVGVHKAPRGSFEKKHIQQPLFYDKCRKSRLAHAVSMAGVIKQCMDAGVGEHDPFMAILSCLAMRVMVVERWLDDKELLDLNSAELVERVDSCRACAIKTAHWSRPIRRLLFAVSDLLWRNGYDLKLSESSLPRVPKEATRPGTPGLQIYGTAGTISKAREDHDLESATSPMDAPSTISAEAASRQPQTRADFAPTGFQNTTDAGLGDPSALDELQLAYNWSNGVYDWEPTHMGWADFDMRWSYDLGQDGGMMPPGWDMSEMG